jgi:hypothetical protein
MPAPASAENLAFVTPYLPDQSETFPESEITAAAGYFGVSRSAAVERLQAENEAMRLQPIVEQRWPSSFGGMWLDESGSPSIFVAFADDAQGHRNDVAAMSERPTSIHGVAVEHSLAALRDTRGWIRSERDSTAAGRPPSDIGPSLRASGGRFSLDIDVRTNRLVVRMARPTDGLQKEMRARYGPNLDVRRGDDGAAFTCTRADCFDESTNFGVMRGGLSLVGGGRGCTSSFTAYGPASGRRFVLSAGHCFAQGTSVANGGVAYGTVDAVRFGGRSDAERIVNGNSAWTETGRVWVEQTDQRSLHYIQSWSGIVVGTQIGKSGNTTGTTRGLVSSRDYTTNGGVPNGQQFILTQGPTAVCVQSGDSGGSVFRNDVAWAITSGAAANNGMILPCSDPTYFSYFGVAEFAQQDLNVLLLSGP